MKAGIIFETSVLLAALCLLPACFETKKEDHTKREKLLIISVVDKEIFDDCHIAGSVHVPLENLEQFAKNLDRDITEIIVYCVNTLCTASAIAGNLLAHMGFKHIWIYEGGIADWYQKGLPTIGNARAAYLTQTYDVPVHNDQKIPAISAQELAHKLNV
jgi:rhodanese-related sulfurtransferase